MNVRSTKKEILTIVIYEKVEEFWRIASTPAPIGGGSGSSIDLAANYFLLWWNPIDFFLDRSSIQKAAALENSFAVGNHVRVPT